MAANNSHDKMRESESIGGGSRQVQFGAPKVNVSTAYEDDYDDDSETDDDDVDPVEIQIESDGSLMDVNERLRHALPSVEIMVQSRCFSKLMAAAATVIMKETLYEITIMREINKMSKLELNLEYVPLVEKYNTHEFGLEKMGEGAELLAFKKFRRDLSWLEQVCKTVVSNLQNNFYFEDLKQILTDDYLTKQEERTLLASKEFNQRELSKLKVYMERERKDLMKMIQEVTEKLGNVKDELHDNIVESGVKMKYVTEFQDARCEQNRIVLDNIEKKFTNVTNKMNTEINKEMRVHEEMWDFLEGSMTEYKDEIEVWMDRYDRDLEEKEHQVEHKKIKIESQRDKSLALKEEYKRRQKEIEDFKEYKLRKQQEAEELAKVNNAATRIQSWWRGVMFRKGLGPWRRKKKGGGNGKAGGGKKGGNGNKKKK